MAEAARRWATDRSCPLPEAPAGDGALRAALEAFAWRHVLVDDDAASERALGQLGAEVRRWSAELERERGTAARGPAPAEPTATILPYRRRSSSQQPGPPRRLAPSLPPPTVLRPGSPPLGLEP